ncbi:MAG: DNA polymerase III subunit alpha, partial [Geminicoccaceae bacterium]|nr:DNA polymerase III subunit alpha [Geminicoccaceae bacterium]
ARIRPEWLEEPGPGLVLLLGEDSRVGQLLERGRAAEAEAALAALARRFPDRLYLAIARTGDRRAAAFEPVALALSRRLGLPAVAHNEVRFLDPGDHEAHEVRVAIARGETLAERRRSPAATPEQYLKDAAAMRALFADLPEVLDNTLELAVRLNPELRFGGQALPRFPVPDGESEVSVLRRQAEAGLEARLAVVPLAAPPERYRERLGEELAVI